jgi:hypothetical protein
VPCKKQLGAIPSPGSVTELPPQTLARTEKSPSAKHPKGGTVGRDGLTGNLQ